MKLNLYFYKRKINLSQKQLAKNKLEALYIDKPLIYLFKVLFIQRFLLQEQQQLDEYHNLKGKNTDGGYG